VAAAPGEVIDAAVACKTRTERIPALDLATRWLDRVIHQELGASIGRTVPPQQRRCEFPAVPEVVRGQEAPAPDTERALSGFALVACIATEGVDVDGPSLLHEPVVDVDATYSAMANAAKGVFRVAAEILTVHRSLTNELLKTFGGEQTAGVCTAPVNAILIELRCVDAFQPVHRAVDGERVGVVRDGRRERKE
jgi:hypothetical protein